jgi:hypothetical protein
MARRPRLRLLVSDPSFGGCTFLLPGNQLDDSSLTVAFQVGSQAASSTTTSDATQLTIIGGPGSPLPQGTTKQQAQYAQLEGKLCTDVFAVVS